MKEKTGEIFSIANDNKPITGCTISKEIYCDGMNYISHFSLACNTDISAEIYDYHKLMIVSEGSLEVYTGKNNIKLNRGQFTITPTNMPVGVRTDKSAVYTEISLRRCVMNNAVKTGEVFNLAGLVPYQEGKVINMDIFHNDKMKFVVMSFDNGTGLAEHSAPGEALIFAIEGQGIIGYEGEEYVIKAGENFKFEKNGKHYVKANGKFKMALLLILE